MNSKALFSSSILSHPLAMHLRPTNVLGRAEKYRGFSFRKEYLMRKPPVTILVCFSICYLFLIQYFRTANYRDPTSYFFSPAYAYKQIYSADRIKEADAFIESAELLPRPRTSGEPLTMCIGVATVARSGEQYVRRTIGSLLEGLTEEERRSLYLTILIGHTEPSKHPIYNEKWVEHLPNKVLKYDKTDIARVQEWEKGGLYRNKTVFDYTYLLNNCYKTGARYVAMIEDDTLAVQGWYPRALQALRNIENEMNTEGRSGQEWVLLRLFYTEELFGWSRENWKTYLFWSFATWTVITSSLLVVRTRNISRPTQAFLSNPAMLAISGFCIPALIALFFASGRNSMRPLAPGIHEMNKKACCSQGHVYPSHIVPSLLQKTNLDTDWLVDMLVEKIADWQGWIRWAEAPALLQHIGTTSSKAYGFDGSARRLWNFGFELYRKSRLDRSHG